MPCAADHLLLATPPPDEVSTAYGPWNPGIESTLPIPFLPLATVFNTVNIFDTVAQLNELHDFCGLPLETLSMFRPERLVLHEVLVRVMADLSVPDGEKYEDLGVNFRRMTARIMDDHVAVRLPAISLAFFEFREKASRFIKDMLKPELPRAETAATGSHGWSLSRLFAAKRPPRERSRAITLTPSGDDAARVTALRHRSLSTSDPFEAACYRALLVATEAVFTKQGRIVNDADLIVSVALRLVCNDHGSSVLGTMIDDVLPSAAEREHYRLLPPQTHPIVMNVKGASASGKSTMRPLQKQLARELGVNWEDFALISPDIWRKYLLNYDSLGPARRYAGTLTGIELAIIDRKLDRYMTHKAKVGNLPHLLIDRFRFDSFSDEPDEEDGNRLLTRFGSDVYMFFMVTPPEETIERAWTRGLQFGRYKAVDDLLAHNVEAYRGIPGLFFTWALRDNKRVHFEFLDNSVPEGHPPKTIAFGSNGVMNILDLNCMLDIDRYQKINVNAMRPSEIYAHLPAKDEDVRSNFVKECVRRIPCVNFANQDSGDIYARTVGGKLVYWDARRHERWFSDRRRRVGIEMILQTQREYVGEPGDEGGNLDARANITLGEWGGRRAP
jgi:hypothetical protein